MKNFALLFALLASVLYGCVTQKSRSDISKTKKFYHDVTSEFNGYFHANELFIAAEAALNTQEPMNYGTLLPVYPYSEVSNPKSQAAALDEAIEKVTKVTALHDPSHWVDDCYLLAGQAQYLKQDYESAEETLEYLIKEFSPKAKLKRDKKRKAKKPRTKKEVEQAKKARTKENEAKKKTREQERKERLKAARKKKKERARENKRKRKERARAKKEAQKARKKGKPVPKSTPKPSFDDPEPDVKTDEGDKKEEEKKKKEEEEEQKKEEEKDDKPNKLKHQPAYQMGQVWLAKTYVERDKFLEAERIFKELNDEKYLYADVVRALAPAKAHYYIKQKAYEDAIPSLEQAIEVANKRKDKARYAFILAQIYQMIGQYSAATEQFERVVKFRPNYEMEFSARMSEVLNQYQSGALTSDKAVKQLERMLKDDKNEEYKGRLYFAIAEIYLKKNDEDKGVEFLELALKEGTGNGTQRAEAFLKLARIYYAKEDYVQSSDYYRQGLAGLKKTDDRYEETKSISDALALIANKIQTIQLQDSLLEISKMTDEEKRELAARMKKEQDEQRRQLLIEQSNNSASPNIAQSRRPGGTARQAAKSNWFAYDERSVKRGLREFERTWGNRVLEDNWRRSAANTSIAATEEDSTANNVISDDQVVNLLRGVPQSKKQIEAAQNKLMEAYFELGELFREKIAKYQKSIETHETLLRRFPDNKYEPQTLYGLYKSHLALGHDVNMENTKSQLINKYPNSVYAKVLADPAYANKVNEDSKLLNTFYDNTYDDFQSGDYQSALNKLQQVESRFGKNNDLQGRFDLLKAMVAGKLQGKDAYVKGLKDVVARYPNSDEQRKAREILRLLGASGVSLPGVEAQKYTYQPDALHYVLIALEPDAVLNDCKIAVSNFNNKYFKLSKLRISNIFLTQPNGGEKIPLVVVRRFSNAKEGLEYLETVEKNSQDFVKDAQYEIYPVTQSSYRQIIKSKSLEEYRDFFRSNYDF